jgi:hypothetical protein
MDASSGLLDFPSVVRRTSLRDSQATGITQWRPLRVLREDGQPAVPQRACLDVKGIHHKTAGKIRQTCQNCKKSTMIKPATPDEAQPQALLY